MEFIKKQRALIDEFEGGESPSQKPNLDTGGKVEYHKLSDLKEIKPFMGVLTPREKGDFVRPIGLTALKHSARYENGRPAGAIQFIHPAMGEKTFQVPVGFFRRDDSGEVWVHQRTLNINMNKTYKLL